MNCKQFACVASILGCLILAGQAEAQTFLQRLGDELSQQLNPPRSNPPPPPVPGDSLPPPRESLPSNSQSRASLGIRVGPVTGDLVRDQKLVVRNGAVITAIEKGSAADRAGLPLGAVIVAFDGRRIDSPEDLVESVKVAQPGRDFELTYYDRNKLGRKKVHLAAVAGGVVAIPNESIRPVVPPPLSAQPPSSLERDLGGGGTRPLLGKIGKVIDGIAAPAQGVIPGPPAEPDVVNRVDPNSEIAVLRQQLAELTMQVETLRKQVASLEQKLSDKK